MARSNRDYHVGLPVELWLEFELGPSCSIFRLKAAREEGWEYRMAVFARTLLTLSSFKPWRKTSVTALTSVRNCFSQQIVQATSLQMNTRPDTYRSTTMGSVSVLGKTRLGRSLRRRKISEDIKENNRKEI